MHGADEDKARRDAYLREYYGRRWFWTVVNIVVVTPAFLFCAWITPAEKILNLAVLAIFFMAAVNLFAALDRRRVTKEHFPPKR